MPQYSPDSVILVFILANTKTLFPILMYRPVFVAPVVSCPITVLPLILTNSGVYEWIVVFTKASFCVLKERKNMKVMLSQPMAGKTDEEIIATRDKAVKTLTEKGYEVVNTLFTDEWYSKENMEKRGVVQIPLCFLAKSLENMSLCHAAYFCKGWEQARGCRIEHDAAIAYGLQILYEE